MRNLTWETLKKLREELSVDLDEIQNLDPNEI